MEWNITEWGRVIWRDYDSIDKFIDAFLYDEESLTNEYHLLCVYWDEAGMLINYWDKTTNKRESCVWSIYSWLEYYEENR